MNLPGCLPNDDDALRASVVAVGDMGRYVLKACLSSKPCSSVYSAFDVRLSRETVIKVVKPAQARGGEPGDLAPSADLLAGIRMAARLQQPFAVTIYDAGLHERDVYVAMERLQGNDLASRLAMGWVPSAEEAARVVGGVAAALVDAHESGMLHGKVEPANVFLTTHNTLKVLNFGHARAGPSTPAAQEWIDGELRYVAPERLLGRPVDERSDVYGLGLLLYEMLAGVPAFAGSSPQHLQRAILVSATRTAHARNPAVPPALSAVAARAMVADPALRYASAREMLQALHEAAAQRPPSPPAVWFDRRLQLGVVLVGLLAVGAWVFVTLGAR